MAANYAKTRGFTVVTLHGDRVDGRGAFSGGFTDYRHSRLEAAKNLKTQTANLKQNQERAKTIKLEVEKLNQQVTEILSHLQQVETRKKKIQVQHEPVEIITKLRKEEDYLTKLIQSKVYSQGIEIVDFQIIYLYVYIGEVSRPSTHQHDSNETASVWLRNRITNRAHSIVVSRRTASSSEEPGSNRRYSTATL